MKAPSFARTILEYFLDRLFSPAMRNKQRLALTIQQRFLDRGLSGVERYGLKHLNNPKSVAEHSYEVERNAAWICALLESKGIEVDELEVSREARVHDEEEEKSSDVPHQVKYGNGMTPAETQLIEEAFSVIAENSINLLYSEMPNPIREQALSAWHRYKTRDTIESQVVKLADIISGIGECLEERRLGNTSVQEDEERYRQLYREFRRKYSWVKSIVEFLPKF